MAIPNIKADYSSEVALELYNEFNASKEDRCGVIHDPRYKITLRASTSMRRDRMTTKVRVGGLLNFYLTAEPPSWHAAKVTNAIARSASGLGRIGILTDPWTRHQFLLRAATMHRRMIASVELWRLRSEIYVGIGAARRAVGQVRLARWSRAVLVDGLATTDEFALMTPDDCIFWRGWCRGMVLGASSKAHERVPGSGPPPAPGQRPTQWESTG